MNIPILISILRNALKASKQKITVKNSKKNLEFVKVLLQQKYILSYSSDLNGNLNIFLNYTSNKNKILSIKHISKPGKPVYFKYKDLWKFNKNLGVIVLNTSKGMISHKTAILHGLGGEALCYII